MSELAFAAIADDFTGAADLAGMLVRGGLRTMLAIGAARPDITQSRSIGDDVQAIVVALKTRSIEAGLAVEQSLTAVQGLRQLGARRLYFKYCSTFDSTASGNIGPVAEALRAEASAGAVPFVPSFPRNDRRVYRGHLFVGDALLNESGMERHPLNPMRDANLVRVLATQSRCGVTLIDRDTVRHGPPAVREALARCAPDRPFAIVDAIEESDLEILAAAFHDLPLVTGGSALALHLARSLNGQSCVDPAERGTVSPRHGRCAVLAGSCSTRTQEQIAHFRARHPALALPVRELVREPKRVIQGVLQWFDSQPRHQPALIYSAEGTATQDEQCLSLGRTIEAAFATLARELSTRGVTRLVVAGGETAGAIVSALGIGALAIGSEISPGVSWAQAVGGAADGLCLALKSGNFGAQDLFIAAFEQLDRRGRAA